MKESKLNVDPNGDARTQAEGFVKAMQGKLAFAKAVALTATLSIKHTYAGQCSNIVHGIANVVKEDWTADAWVATVELSKADLDRLTGALQKPTNGGDFDISMGEGGSAEDDVSFIRFSLSHIAQDRVHLLRFVLFCFFTSRSIFVFFSRRVGRKERRARRGRKAKSTRKRKSQKEIK